MSNYPSTPTVGDAGGANWVRGVGGGLSTVSGSLSADHLMIVGNRAAHGGDKSSGGDYDWASTIAGFIITDKPVITMPPNSVQAYPGDTPITLSACAVGVPPLSYQWFKDGLPIAGATASKLSIATANAAAIGNYDVVVANLYGQATSEAATVAVDARSP